MLFYWFSSRVDTCFGVNLLLGRIGLARVVKFALLASKLLVLDDLSQHFELLVHSHATDDVFNV